MSRTLNHKCVVRFVEQNLFAKLWILHAGAVPDAAETTDCFFTTKSHDFARLANKVLLLRCAHNIADEIARLTKNFARNITASCNPDPFRSLPLAVIPSAN